MTAAQMATVPACPTTSGQFGPKTVQSVTLKDELAEEALSSLEEYRRTGYHVTFDEFRKWAADLRSDPNAKLPECHA